MPQHAEKVHARLAFYWGFLLLGVGAAALALINSVWLFNKRDIDVWFYYGYSRYFLDYWDAFKPTEAHAYYATRIPYTLVGHFFYSIFDPAAARYIFKLAFLYPSVVALFFYVGTRHFPLRVAFVSSVALATDIYFLRAIGSDYVDAGVLLFQLLTFALLAKAIEVKRPQPLLVLAGFMAASMVCVHLLSSVLLPVFFAYYLVFANSGAHAHPVKLKILVSQVLLYVTCGFVLCVIFYGSILKVLVDDPPLFFAPQFQTLLLDTTSNYKMPMAHLWSGGYWLSVHFGAAVASGLGLLLALISRRPIEPFSKFWLLAGLALYSFLGLAHSDGLWFLASRDGLYATFFLPLTYYALAALLFGRSELSGLSAAVSSILLFGSIAARISLGGASVIPSVSVPAIGVAAFVAVIGLIGFVAASRNINIGAVCASIFAGITMLIPWRFDGSSSVYAAHDIIAEQAAGRLPKMFWANASAHAGVFHDITSSFTERAWWQRGWNYPDCLQIDGGGIAPGDLVVIMSSAPVDVDSKEKFQRCIGDLVSVREAQVKHESGSYWLSLFEVPIKGRRILLLREAISLPSQTGSIEGRKRLAKENYAKDGYLTFGPYINMAPGRYSVEIVYSATTDANHWDVVAQEGGAIHTLSRGALTATGTELRSVIFNIALDSPKAQVGFRTFYSGQGVLVVERIAVTKEG